MRIFNPITLRTSINYYNQDNQLIETYPLKNNQLIKNNQRTKNNQMIRNNRLTRNKQLIKYFQLRSNKLTGNHKLTRDKSTIIRLNSSIWINDIIIKTLKDKSTTIARLLN
jgi:hypothetical protein